MDTLGDVEVPGEQNTFCALAFKDRISSGSVGFRYERTGLLP